MPDRRHRSGTLQRRACSIALVLACVGSGRAPAAAELSVDVTDARGRPAANAVIELQPVAAAARPTPPAARTRNIDQKDETFIPYVEIFRPGDSVVFTNSDATRHHVYSFAAAKRFEFVLAAGERSPPLRVQDVGSIAVGCNIHDRMITYLYVTDAAWAARTDAQGHASIVELPAGEYRLSVWHPQVRVAPAPRAVVLDSTHARQHSSFALPLMADARGERDLEDVDY
jgi:plastocyanin